MKFLVFQHIEIEHPGIFRQFFRQDGVEWHTVELDEGEEIPPLEGYDALWVMGGPMDTWLEHQHPWLKQEKRAIRQAVVERKMPYFGFCLGHQLLAEALGGQVGPSATAEIGVLDVELTQAGRQNPFMAWMPASIPCLQWHSAEVKSAPANASVVAHSPACPVQAMAIENRALSIQYHVEITADTVTQWGAIPEYKAALEKALGSGGLAKLATEAALNIEQFNRYSRLLYDNWMNTVFAGRR